MYRRKENNSKIIESLKESLDCGIPTFIEDDIFNLRCRNEAIFCEPCNIPINIVLANKTETTDNFKLHIFGDYHKQNVSEKDNLKRIHEKFKMVYPQKPIPQIVYVNQLFLKDEGKYYFCKLCNVRLSFSNYRVKIPESENAFCEHLLSNTHVDKVKVFYDMCYEVKAKLEEIYGIVHSAILDNVEFITKKHNDYICDLCKKPLSVDSTNVDLTIEQFKLHLQSSDHKQNAEQEKAFQKIPELKDTFPLKLPNYIIRNIEYINYDYRSFYFCSLCNESIPIVDSGCSTILYDDCYKTEQNLKYHLSSPIHIGNLFSKRDPKNDVYRKLHQLFETFPIRVKRLVQSLGRKEGDFYCHTCKCKIIDENDVSYTEKNILSHFVPGYRNLSIDDSIHGEHLVQKSAMSSYIMQYLKSIFETVPVLIQENIEYLKMYTENPNIVFCYICNVELQFFDDKPDTTRKQVEQHLRGKYHKNKLDDIESDKNFLRSSLLKQFAPRFYRPPFSVAFNPVPRFIENNHHCISYVDTSEESDYNYVQSLIYTDCSSDDESSDWYTQTSKEIESRRVSGYNYYCNVCCNYSYSPKVIPDGKSLYVYDDDDELIRNRVIEYNFRTHLLSKEHKVNMQNEAFEILRTQRKMDSLFGTIPTYVYNNIEHMSVDKIVIDAIYCTLCDDWNHYKEKFSIEQHIIGRSRFSPSDHQTREICIEDSNNLAMEILDMRFWKVPEIVVKNIDFLEISGSNIFCVLCQETLYIDEYDLEQTEYDFCIHMKSRKHMVSLNELYNE